MRRAFLITITGVSILSFATVSCGKEGPVETRDPTAAFEWMTSRHFGDIVEASRVAANVGGEAITFGEIAVCLDYIPVLSPEECLDSLIDMYLVNEHATDADRSDPRVEDARRSGLANVELRERIERPLGVTPIDESTIEDFLQNPETRPFVDVPELRTCSHLLVQGPRGDDGVMEFLQQIHDEVDWSDVRTSSDLNRIAAEYRDAGNELAYAFRVEAHLTFPAHSEPPTHGGLIRAEKEFSDALFEVDLVGSVSAPVQTSYGAHIILLEEIIPARHLSISDARALAVHELTQRTRAEMMNEEVMGITERYEVEWIRDNLAYLGSQYDDLLQSQSERLREEIVPDE